ncbi:MAG: DUF4954 family protein [Bacteroidota bacterium]
MNRTETAALKAQGCFSSDWSKIRVSEEFTTDPVHNVRFRGEVIIGKTAGLYNCTIDHCTIGDDVLIDNVHLVQNYRIGDDVILENVDTLTVSGQATFGNGVEISVLNEGGGREVVMFDKLNAQLAYMLVIYRHEPSMIDAINRMIRAYCNSRTSGTGSVGRGSVVRNAGTLSNVVIGEDATIRGVTLLENGTIASNRHAPVKVGEGVIARNFIIQSGSTVDGGALLESCFIGQGVEVGKQFSGEHSLFFANSEAFHGEAVSIFAGPYTVTHHKSTLLIAGIFSFYNAGSGTNQSNHMYKLGPVHQGIVERGSKTGSFAYMLWPSRVGAYTVVMGKNMAHFDTSELPFSYINEEHGRSILTPGMNLLTVGTRRDSEKWPLRDRREDPEKSDLISFELLSPYVIQQVMLGLEILTGLYEKTDKKQDSVFYKGVRIKRLMLKSTRKYYEMALDLFIGNQIIKKLEQAGEIKSIEALQKVLSPVNKTLTERWIDLSGMVAPAHLIQELTGEINDGGVKSLEEIFSRLQKIHEGYDLYAWDWTTKILAERLGFDMANINPAQLIDLVSQWETASLRLDRMILSDASKEYDNISKTGFGPDGDASVAEMDFKAVRGTPEENKFILGIHRDMEQIQQRAASALSLLGRI